MVVADDSNIGVAARRIMWGKLLNTGQTCIAPNHVICTPATQEKLIEACKEVIEEFYGKVIITSECWSMQVHAMIGLHYRTRTILQTTGELSVGSTSSK